MVARLAGHLPGYLRHPLSPEEREAIVRRRLEHRQEGFLEFVQRAVYGSRTNPYRSLLQHAGCEVADLRRLVEQEGIEGALSELMQQGVYLTLDEFKGRVPVVRGSLRIEVAPDQLRNPLSVTHVLASTSGSRGRSTSIGLDLASVRDRSVNMLLALRAWQAEHCRMAIWTVRGLTPLLWFSGNGRPVERWFRHGTAQSQDIGDKFEWGRRVATWTSSLVGVPLPKPEYVGVEQPIPVVTWLSETLAAGHTPHLWSTPSSTVRLCRQAETDGVDIAGACFTLTGEPITAARLAVVEGSGAVAAPDYGAAETGGSVAYGCREPRAPDDVHVFTDLNALIAVQNHRDLPDGALFLTTLRPTVPFVMINASMGDCATLETRACGCPMERLGWRLHLRGIRSYEKLTVGGVSFEDTPIIEILERELPARFGGGPTDYQVVEETGDDDRSRLLLLAHPDIGCIDEEALANAFLSLLGKGSETRREMALHLRQSGMPEIERRSPAADTGKIQHLAIADRK